MSEEHPDPDELDPRTQALLDEGERIFTTKTNNSSGDSVDTLACRKWATKACVHVNNKPIEKKIEDLLKVPSPGNLRKAMNLVEFTVRFRGTDFSAMFPGAPAVLPDEAIAAIAEQHWPVLEAVSSKKTDPLIRSLIFMIGSTQRTMFNLTKRISLLEDVTSQIFDLLTGDDGDHSNSSTSSN